MPDDDTAYGDTAYDDTAYLDNAATTPVRPEALDAMLPFLTRDFGNPSGSHRVARRAKQAIEEAREIVAAALGVLPSEVVFTAGGTEADNLAVLGWAARGRALCSAVEHHAVLHAVEAVGGAVVPVDGTGRVRLDALDAALGDDVGLVSVMLANNEVGTIQPLAEVVDLVRRRAPKALVHTDAVQAFPWLDVASLAAGADLVAVSAHKFGGPKGIGALAVRGGVALHPIVLGGGQEAGRRSGTHDVAGIAGMAAAVVATEATRAATVALIAARRDRLVAGLVALGAVETVPPEMKVAGNAHVRFPGVETEALLVRLDEEGVCASAGSACASGALEPSHVLAAMGIPSEGSVRFSLGWATTDADIDRALAAVPRALAMRSGW
ncbi:MAG TPA: cysteine desulfurase family protein [Acidimicrobiales bacterium]|nr:cysteine desulfurase family protein [Acidimicrobiales bacterium]